MSLTEVVPGRRCVCCGHSIRGTFRLCLGCQRKRDKIYDDCIASGRCDEWSRERVNIVYPEKYVY